MTKNAKGFTYSVLLSCLPESQWNAQEYFWETKVLTFNFVFLNCTVLLHTGVVHCFHTLGGVELEGKTPPISLFEIWRTQCYTIKCLGKLVCIHLNQTVHSYHVRHISKGLRVCIHVTIKCNNYIILDGFEGDKGIYCTSYDNIALVFDSCNIVIARAIYSCIPLKAIQYYISIHCIQWK